MPTYEYACKSCGEHLEVVQSFRDEPLTACPACGGPLRKVFGNIGIAFKGSGFYKTDSRSSGSAAKTATKEPAADSGSSSPAPPASSAPSAGSSGSGGSSSSAAAAPAAAAS